MAQVPNAVDRQTTDGRAIAYSERELTFTFANKIILKNFSVLF